MPFFLFERKKELVFPPTPIANTIAVLPRHRLFYHGSLVKQIINATSVFSLDWRQDVMTFACLLVPQYASEEAELLLVGNKLDCETDRIVTKQQAERVRQTDRQTDKEFWFYQIMCEYNSLARKTILILKV